MDRQLDDTTMDTIGRETRTDMVDHQNRTDPGSLSVSHDESNREGDCVDDGKIKVSDSEAQQKTIGTGIDSDTHSGPGSPFTRYFEKLRRKEDRLDVAELADDGKNLLLDSLIVRLS